MLFAHSVLTMGFTTATIPKAYTREKNSVSLKTIPGVDAMSTGSTSEGILDGRWSFQRYIWRLVRYGRESDDGIVSGMTAARLAIVRMRLLSLGGIVTKLHLPAKATTTDLWKAVDTFENEYQLRRGKVSLFHLPTKAYYGYSGYETPYGQDRFLNPRYHSFDVHHIWPETLGGPTEGWNVIPLPKNVHLFELHEMIDSIVRDSAIGQRIRLL